MNAADLSLLPSRLSVCLSVAIIHHGDWFSSETLALYKSLTYLL